MTYRPPFVDTTFRTVPAPHPATLSTDDFLAQCRFETGRVSGPGGQHRNRVDTAVSLVHVPTDLDTQATERRSQLQNRSKAIFRLRLKLAVRCRTVTSRDRHEPSELWKRRRQGEKMPVNPEHEDYPALLAEALDVIVARRYDVAGAAGVLGVTMSQLTRLVRHERHAFALLNEGREKVGLAKLRS
ncbi:MAG: peptide chain release factor-like protein [Phycisphaerales bacterium]